MALGLQHTEYGEQLDGEGLVLGGTFPVHGQLLAVGSVTGSVVDTSRFNVAKDIRSVHFRLGGGYRFTVPGADLNLYLQAVRAEFRYEDQMEADNGFEATFEARRRLGERLEGRLAMDYLHLLAHGAMSFAVSGLYAFSGGYGLGLGYTLGEDQNTYTLSGRAEF